MRTLKVLLTTVIVVSLSITLAYAGKDTNEGNEGKGIENQGRGLGHRIEVIGDRGNVKHPQQALQRQNISKQQIESAIRYAPQQAQENIAGLKKVFRGNRGEENSFAVSNLNNALQKLERSRWAYNLNDTRGQGNMGQPTMISPYGQDKDSDRLELYGNRGRVVKDILPPPPDPVPVPDPTPEPTPTPDPTPQPEPTPTPTPDPTPPPEPDPYYPPF